MPSEKDGVMIILSSPSGAGKTTLVKKLSEEDNFEISISHTTRQPRPNEKKNEDYFFVDELEFKRLIKNEEFLEYAKVFNNFYGTTRTPVIDKLNKRKNVLFDIDWQGADQIKNKKLDVDSEIDGGINFENCTLAKQAGANILVSGSTIFKENKGDLKKNIEILRKN